MTVSRVLLVARRTAADPPPAAVQPARNRGFGEIEVPTLPRRLSRRLPLGLPGKARALGVPAPHVADDDELDPGLGVNAWLLVVGWILDAGLRCVVEIHDRDWEPRLLLCYEDLDGIEAAVERWIAAAPQHSARVAGYTRDLRRVQAAPTALCHVA